MINITPIKAFNDNYIWAITTNKNNKLILVDPGQTQPCLDFIQQNQLELSSILITHHHNDHIGAIDELIKLNASEINVYGPANEKIPHITHQLVEGDAIQFNDFELSLNVYDVPGHTAGHIVYFNEDVLFSGDTLFSGGCGRLFEGTAEQMHHSLSKLKQLPANTKVYCAHEYTLANLYFALAVEPENAELLHYFNQVKHYRDNNQATIPTTIGQERKINPFLRYNELNVKNAAEQYANVDLHNEAAVFAAVRRWKDNF